MESDFLNGLWSWSLSHGKDTGSFADYMLFQWDRIQPEGTGRGIEGSQKTP